MHAAHTMANSTTYCFLVSGTWLLCASRFLFLLCWRPVVQTETQIETKTETETDIEPKSQIQTTIVTGTTTVNAGWPRGASGVKNTLKMQSHQHDIPFLPRGLRLLVCSLALALLPLDLGVGGRILAGQVGGRRSWQVGRRGGPCQSSCGGLHVFVVRVHLCKRNGVSNTHSLHRESCSTILSISRNRPHKCTIFLSLSFQPLNSDYRHRPRCCESVS